MDATEFYLEDLKSKFMKINPSDYYLSYSGGRDSHFLFWFIKEYLHDDKIEIVGINTGLEFKEISDRMKNNSDRILKPTKTYAEIKEVYGIPCFSKMQDELIYIYRKHIAENKEISPYLKERIYNDDGKVSYFRLNSVAREALFSGKLHKVSHLCCKYMKKYPARNYEKEFTKKPIIGMMQSESVQRKAGIKSCFNKNGYFYPIFDLSNEIQSKIEEKYGIEVPDIYRYVSQTGCVGCPYGITYGQTIKGLSLCTPQQRKFVLDYFKESYEVRGLFYQYKFNF